MEKKGREGLLIGQRKTTKSIFKLRPTRGQNARLLPGNLNLLLSPPTPADADTDERYAETRS
jgi:hypothetical protein